MATCHHPDFLLETYGANIPVSNVAVIGNGSYGIVFFGYFVERWIWKPCAIKYFESSLPAPEDRTRKKVEKLLKLNDINLVKLFCYGLITERVNDVLPDEYRWGIIMELCQGGTLHSMVVKNVLKTQSIVKYMQQLLLGLRYLHENEMVHGDLKGENIFLTKNCSQVKIGDLDDHISLESLYFEQDLMGIRGTWKWMSPEMVLTKQKNSMSSRQRRWELCSGTPVTKMFRKLSQEIGPPTDIWSLGCVVLEMITQDQFVLTKKNGKNVQINSRNMLKAARLSYFPSALEPTKVDAVLKHFLTLCFKIKPKSRPSAQALLGQDVFQTRETSTGGNQTITMEHQDPSDLHRGRWQWLKHL